MLRARFATLLLLTAATSRLVVGCIDEGDQGIGPISDLPVTGVSDAGTSSQGGGGSTPDTSAPDAPGSAPNVPVEGGETGLNGDSNTGAPPGAVPCDLEGSWELVRYTCGDTDVTAAWQAAVSSTTLTITRAADGSCEVLVDNQGALCAETERFTLTPTDEGQLVGSSLGIESCEPEACAFTAGDATCEPGDRAADDRVLDYTVDGNALTLTEPEPTDVCNATGEPDVTTYERVAQSTEGD